MKSQTDKDRLIEKLRKSPIVGIACKQVGIGRTTFYRWKKEDSSFAEKADEALFEGTSIVNDLAEGYLINAIQQKDLSAIMWWLRHRHPGFTNKLEVTGTLEQQMELTEEDKKLVAEAMRLALPDKSTKGNDSTKSNTSRNN